MMQNTKTTTGFALIGLVSGLMLIPLSGSRLAQAAEAAPIAVQDVPPQVEAKADQTQQVRTTCFEFVAAPGSQITGSGCRTAVSLNRTQYFTIETLEATQPGATLQSSADQLLQGIQQSLDGNPATRAGLDKPGPYDSVQMGKYVGQKAGKFQGMPSIEMRWDNRGNIVPAVKVLTLVALPKARYVWDGKPQQYLMLSWYELDSDYARYSRVARDSVKLF